MRRARRPRRRSRTARRSGARADVRTHACRVVACARSMSAPPRRAWVAAVPGGLLVLLAIWELVAALRTTAPDDEAWAAAAAIVRARHRPGDLIVFAPAWADP